MEIELVATGDELLNGTIVDTNSPWLMDELAGLSLAVRRKVTVRDRRDDIVWALRSAAGRSEVVIVSGGLGPTADDITAECAAEAAGVELVLHEPTLASIESRMARHGIAITPNNRRQARVPLGATVHPNRFGTAPMIELVLGDARAFLLPGVPREFRGLCEERLLPLLGESLPERPLRRLRTLRCFGAAESHLDAALEGLDRLFPGLEVGYRTTLPENHVRLVMTGRDVAAVDRTLADAVREARQRIGLACYSSDGRSFSRLLGDLLVARQATVALAESLTGGLAAAALTEVPGASRYLKTSLVTYTEGLKRDLLGVPAALLEAHGAVSEPVAAAMAEGARRVGQATFGLSCTGLAGPDGDESAQPVGTVFTALASATETRVTRHAFRGERDRVRSFTTYAMLDALRRRLEGEVA